LTGRSSGTIGAMSSRDARGGVRKRFAALSATTIVLIVVPIGLGFRVAGADTITFASGTQAPVVTVTSPGDTSTELPDAIDSATGEEPVTIEDALTPRPDEITQSRITWLRPGVVAVPVPNGGAITIADSVEVTITAEPYPPDNFDPARVDFVVTRNGETVEGATMWAQYDMRLMLHGPFPVDLGTGTDGVFSLVYQPFMFGPWQVDASVSLPGSDPIAFSISIYVWPTT
jgi:hypothetical protein